MDLRVPGTAAAAVSEGARGPGGGEEGTHRADVVELDCDDVWESDAACDSDCVCDCCE